MSAFSWQDVPSELSPERARHIPLTSTKPRLYGSQTKVHPPAPRARRTDPTTSHAAAKRAENFVGTHVEQIQEALVFAQGTAREISAVCGLTVEQIDRRLPEMQRAFLVRVVTNDGLGDLTRDGFRVWELV